MRLREAEESLAAGDADAALRAAIPALEASPDDVDALLLVVDALARSSRMAGLAEPATALSRDLGAGGRWPTALVAAALAAEAGADHAAILGDLALVYGAGSEKVGEGLAVPAAPTRDEVSASLGDEVHGGALYARALQAVTIAASARPAAKLEAATSVPRAPLLAHLGRDAFVKLASAFRPRRLADDETLLSEGEEGDAVFVLAEGVLRVTRFSSDAPGEVELARLGPGALVGEMAIVSRAPRSATVRARGPALVLEATRDELDEAASDPSVAEELVAHCRRRMAETLLVASPMLAPLPSDERPAVLAALAPRTLSAGERLITRGEEADGLTLVVQGEVEVSRDDGGEHTVIARLGPGNVVGEISVVMRRPANADVVVTEDGLGLFLARDAFLPLAKAHPTLLARLYELAVEREEETLSLLAADAVPAEELLI